MESFYLLCAGLGGTLIVLQLAANMLGFGGEHDVSHDVGHDLGHADGGHGNWLAGALSVRAITAAITFFGLGGMTAYYYGAEDPAALAAAVAAGVAALYAVAALMGAMHRLRAEGTARIERAVGRTGSVYLRVPGSRAGLGKVHLALQNRTVEYQAVTAGSELPTGTPVKVVGVVNADTVEVVAA